MQYTDGIGIQATAPEIAALLSFCRDEEATVSVKVADGKLLAFAANGIAAVYNHGEAWDGKGKPSKLVHNWQFSADALKMVRGGMSKGDEVIFTLGKSGDVKSADIRDIETGNKKPSIELTGFVSEQLEFDMPSMLPTRPGRDTGELPSDQIALSYSVISLLAKVCKAADTEASRFFIPSDPHQAIYVEVDKPSRLYDEEQPRWVCVLMPLKLSSAAEVDEGDEE